MGLIKLDAHVREVQCRPDSLEQASGLLVLKGGGVTDVKVYYCRVTSDSYEYCTTRHEADYLRPST